MADLLEGRIKANGSSLILSQGRIVSYLDPDPDRPGAPPDNPQQLKS